MNIVHSAGCVQSDVPINKEEMAEADQDFALLVACQFGLFGWKLQFVTMKGEMSLIGFASSLSPQEKMPSLTGRCLQRFTLLLTTHLLQHHQLSCAYWQVRGKQILPSGVYSIIALILVFVSANASFKAIECFLYFFIITLSLAFQSSIPRKLFASPSLANTHRTTGGVRASELPREA